LVCGLTPRENGGLFIGRRPGTAPVKYRTIPQRGSDARARKDRFFARAVFAAMVLICMAFWGPIPIASLWIASQIQYLTGSVSLGILIGFAVLIVVLLLGLMGLRRLDLLWILLRRASGYDQRRGVLGPIFAATAAVGVVLFSAWLLLFAGPGPSLAPTG